MSLASLIARTRLELSDQGESFQAQITADGSSTTYDLPVRVATATGLVVAVQGGATLATPADYTVNEREGEINFTAVRPSGQILNVSGTSYRYFPDEDIETFVSEAFGHHNVGRLPAVTYETLPEIEEYLVAILASIEALWVMATDASFDIDIQTPEGTVIPRSQRFAQIMGLIQQRTLQYEELASALNVGIKRIQVFTLRRVSRTTNRLVPIYIPQEFDDRSYPPVRVYPPIDSGLTG